MFPESPHISNQVVFLRCGSRAKENGSYCIHPVLAMSVGYYTLSSNQFVCCYGFCRTNRKRLRKSSVVQEPGKQKHWIRTGTLAVRKRHKRVVEIICDVQIFSFSFPIISSSENTGNDYLLKIGTVCRELELACFDRSVERLLKYVTWSGCLDPELKCGYSWLLKMNSFYSVFLILTELSWCRQTELRP